MELSDINHAMDIIIKARVEKKSVKVEVSTAGSGNLQIDSVVVALTVLSTWEFSMEKLRWQSWVLADSPQLDRYCTCNVLYKEGSFVEHFSHIQ